MYSVYFINGLSAAIPSFVILRFDIRYSAVRCLTQAQLSRRGGRFHPKGPKSYPKFVKKEAPIANNQFADGCAFIEGEYLPIADARIPIIDTGFTRSDLTYDVVVVWNGNFFRLDDQLNRFQNGKSIGNGKPGKITSLIRTRYWQAA